MAYKIDVLDRWGKGIENLTKKGKSTKAHKMQIYLKRMTGEILPMEIEEGQTHEGFLEQVYRVTGSRRWKVLYPTKEGEFEEIKMDEEELNAREEDVFSIVAEERPPYEIDIQLSSMNVYDTNHENECYHLYEIAVVSEMGDSTMTTIQGIYVKPMDDEIHYYMEDFDSIPAYHVRCTRWVEWEIEISETARMYHSLEDLVNVSKLGEGLTEEEKVEMTEKMMKRWNEVTNR